MASILSPSSREATLTGFPTNLAANSGRCEGTFFIGAPNGVKHVKEFENEQADGSIRVNRAVSYSMLINGTDVHGRKRTFCCYLNLRRSDFTEGGRYGDNTIEVMLDTMLAQAIDTGISSTIDLVADADRMDRDNNHVAGKDGQAFLA